MKNILGRLPNWLFVLLKVIQYRVKISGGRFTTKEPEFYMLDKWIKPGSAAIDIGANHGVYTRAMAKYADHVIAVEPVKVNFSILRSVTSELRNVFLYKYAATSKRCDLRIEIPVMSGYKNLYQSKVSDRGQPCKGLRVDSLHIPDHVSLIKIDAEGHDYEALKGCEKIIDVCKPTIIIESDTVGVNEFLVEKGYRKVKTDGSPNTVYFHGWK